MKRTLLIGISCLLLPVQTAYAFEKTRLIIMADMGNEPDEEQQMMHMLMYSNMFDLEGLIGLGHVLKVHGNGTVLKLASVDRAIDFAAQAFRPRRSSVLYSSRCCS